MRFEKKVGRLFGSWFCSSLNSNLNKFSGLGESFDVEWTVEKKQVSMIGLICNASVCASRLVCLGIY